jgi:hypothetical protein
MRAINAAPKVVAHITEILSVAVGYWLDRTLNVEVQLVYFGAKLDWEPFEVRKDSHGSYLMLAI